MIPPLILPKIPRPFVHRPHPHHGRSKTQHVGETSQPKELGFFPMNKSCVSASNKGWDSLFVERAGHIMTTAVVGSRMPREKLRASRIGLG